MTSDGWRELRVPTRWLIGAVLLSACSFSGDSHPAACETNSDCKNGYSCYQKFCIAESGSSVTPPRDEDGSMSMPDSDGSSGTGGEGGGGGTSLDGSSPVLDGSSPGGDSATPEVDTGLPTGDGSTDPDAATTLDADTPDAGPTVPPYAACSGNQDCNSDEVCRMSSGNGVCAAPCSVVGDCAEPSGSYTATPTCDTGRCRLDCAPNPPVPPFPRTCPAAMSCILESGAQSCYPQ